MLVAPISERVVSKTRLFRWWCGRNDDDTTHSEDFASFNPFFLKKKKKTGQKKFRNTDTWPSVLHFSLKVLTLFIPGFISEWLGNILHNCSLPFELGPEW